MCNTTIGRPTNNQPMRSIIGLDQSYTIPLFCYEEEGGEGEEESEGES